MKTTQLEIAKKIWSKEFSDGKLVYSPDDMDADKQFSFIVYPVEDLGDQSLREWFSFTINGMQSELGPADKKWTIKEEKNGSLGASNTFKNKLGKKLSVGYNGIPVNDNSAFILQMLSVGDLMTLLRYGSCYDEVMADARNTLLSGQMQA